MKYNGENNVFLKNCENYLEKLTVNKIKKLGSGDRVLFCHNLYELGDECLSKYEINTEKNLTNDELISISNIFNNIMPSYSLNSKKCNILLEKRNNEEYTIYNYECNIGLHHNNEKNILFSLNFKKIESPT